MTKSPSSNDIAVVRLPNGVSLQCRETGERNGIPLVLLHGVTDSLHSWKPFTDALPPSIRAFAFSQRGHGDSSKPESGYEAADFSADLAALLDAIGISSAHIVGHSMGAWIAQGFARDFPDRVDSLVLIGGFVSLAGNTAAAQLTGAVKEMGDTIDPAFVHDFQLSTVASALPANFLQLVVSESLKAPARVWRATFEAMTNDQPSLGRVPHPALLIAGGKDEIFGDEDRKRLAEIFSAPRFILYEALGHAPHWEEPRIVARDIANFLSELKVRPRQIKPQGRAS